jgi:S-adenosylmethionine-diacylglycerol 3-amino-3-carboxypropyl transferase
MAMRSEVASKADFSGIRYAQCWEDADVLLEGLDIQPGDVCLSIASAGDNSLALLTRRPGRVIALDLSPAQLACVELRVAGYRELEHAELLELIGSTPPPLSPPNLGGDKRGGRAALYQRCRSLLSAGVREFWDAHPNDIENGVGSAGKFERYFARFRGLILPLVHVRSRVEALLRGGTRAERLAFYKRQWDTCRWRLLFRIFFSRFVMGRMARDPSFFTYVEGSVADRILARAKHAVTELNPAENPYLHWIMSGRHTTALPLALRPEHFEVIRNNLERLEWRCQSVEDFLQSQDGRTIDRFNLSDIFEYMSPENYQRLLGQLASHGKIGGRLAYWNMLAPRSRPESMSAQLRPLEELSQRLHWQDKAFFYSRFIVEEII